MLVINETVENDCSMIESHLHSWIYTEKAMILLFNDNTLQVILFKIFDTKKKFLFVFIRFHCLYFSVFL